LNIFQALILGILQGLTEFLPISSSGHLVIAQHFLNYAGPELVFDVALHFATLIAVVIYFRAEIGKMISAIFHPQDVEGRRTLVLLIYGTIPAGIIGLTFKDFLESLFSSAGNAAIMIIITGCILLSSRINRKAHKTLWKLKWFDAVIVGTAQAVAIIPGISRSGSTIVTGIHLGFDKKDAARFSFLLSVPAILGASFLHLKDMDSFPLENIPSLLTAMAAAAIMGYLSIAVLLKIIGQGKLYYFAPYCFAVGIITLIFL